MRLCVYDDDRVGVRTADGGLVDITDLLDRQAPPPERMRALIEGWDHLQKPIAQQAHGPGKDTLHA
jgi:hypothetical protein